MDQATFSCQLCRARLHLRGDFDGLLLGDGAASTLRASDPASSSRRVFDSAKIDESFVVLDEKRAQQQQQQQQHAAAAAAAAARQRLLQALQVLAAAVQVVTSTNWSHVCRVRPIHIS